MNADPDDIADNILSNIVQSLGPQQWERRLGERERALVRACCADAARLSVRALASPRQRDAQVELLREKARIHARLATSAALGGPGRLADAFWDAVRNTVNGAVAVAFAAL